jgi:hypothetical protein
MSRHLSPFAAKLRRELLAKGLTLKPTCEACGREVEPKAIQADLCPNCKAERDEAAVYFQRLADETDWPILPQPEFPIFGGPEAGRPFLPDDEDHWTEQQRLADIYLAAEAEKYDEKPRHIGNAEDLF